MANRIIVAIALAIVWGVVGFILFLFLVFGQAAAGGQGASFPVSVPFVWFVFGLVSVGSIIYVLAVKKESKKNRSKD